MGLFNRKILSIDFGSYEIKVIEGKDTKNGIHILNYLTVKLPEDAYKDGEILDKDSIVKLLKDRLKENKIKTDLAYGVINSSSIITREITIPKVSDGEISSLIGFQVGEFLPIVPEDYIVNHIVLGSVENEEVEKLKILLIAVPKDLVISHLELMKEVNLKPEVLDYQGNAIAKLLKYSGSINENYNTRDIGIASIDMGYSSTKLTIVKNGKIEVSRVIDMGSETLYHNIKSFFDYSLKESEEKVMDIENIIDEDEEFTDYFRLVNLTRTTLVNLMEKIEAIFRYYTSRESSNKINLILLQGGLSKISGLDNLFSNYFNISSIKLSSLDKVNIDGDLNTYCNAVGSLVRLVEVKK